MIALKEIIENKTYGNLLSFTGKWGDYMPNWHPWEDYRTTYAAKKELGGGVALTLSHDIDLANWLASAGLKKYNIHKNYRSTLEMDVEGGADILLSYDNGVTGHLHLNYYEKTPERYLRLVFDDASIFFDYIKNKLAIKTTENNQPKIKEANGFDRNDMFIEQTRFFYNKISNYTVAESLKQIEESELIIEICNEQ
jgi:predicted dehydrogenase